MQVVRGGEHDGDMVQLVHVDWSVADDFGRKVEAERERKVAGMSVKVCSAKSVVRRIHL